MGTPPVLEPGRVDAALYERPRSRALKRVLGSATAALIIGFVLATVLVLLRYEPLTTVGAGSIGGGGTVVGAAGPTPGYTLTYAPDTTFEYSFSVQNTGRWGITVTGIDPRTQAGFSTTGAFDEDGDPLGTRALAPGETLRLTVRARFESCPGPPPEGRSTWSSERVRYELLGVRRDMAVRLPMEMTVLAPTAFHCPL